MPRARNIKPGFFENEFIGSLPGDMQILFIGLWTQADREGIIEYRPAKLRKALFGFRSDITDEIFIKYLDEFAKLDGGSMLSFSVCNGRDYIVINNFLDHQSPHKTEKKGKCPPLKTLLEGKRQDLTVKAPLDNGENRCRNALIPDLLIPERGMMIDENVQEKFERAFDDFWEAYPKNKRSKGSRKDARNKFQIALKKDNLENIMQGVMKYADYIRNTGQSNKDAFRWLEKEGWRDDYTIQSYEAKITTRSKHQRAREALGL